MVSVHSVLSDNAGPFSDLPRFQGMDVHLENPLSPPEQKAVADQAHQLTLDAYKRSSLFAVEALISLYPLSSREGRALMELTEALLRIPDKATQTALIKDKLLAGRWLSRRGKGVLRSVPVALAAAKLIARFYPTFLRPVFRWAIERVGQRFVFAETIEDAIAKAQQQGGLFSFDMLGEGARTDWDACRYFEAYADAIKAVGRHAGAGDPQSNHGVSVKLSALSCRFHTRYWQELKKDLTPRLLQLAKQARKHNVPLTIDAEEQSRLVITLGLFNQLLEAPGLKGWHGLGIAVQAYGRRAAQVIDFLEWCARANDQRIAVRLVKGAYWDSEIKTAQEKGLDHFPVWTDKADTDKAYLSLARRLMTSDCIHPQFASHNPGTLAAVALMARELRSQSFEMQKLFGMGDAIHDAFKAERSCPLRVYAPVGRQQDLLSYLVRRLLENGAATSFLHQFGVGEGGEEAALSPTIRTGADLFHPDRVNSIGIDLDEPAALASIQTKLIEPQPFELTAKRAPDLNDWPSAPMTARAEVLNKIAEQFEAHREELTGLLTQEAGKTFDDAHAELREAVDFCRYYASQALQMGGGVRPRGIVLAISPWNFPLAIFTGQIVAALVTGNRVVAKPASLTPRIAKAAVYLMHQAGVPDEALKLVIGDARAGQDLLAKGFADLVVFTGSTATAKAIEATVAGSPKPLSPIIAETGGLNAVIIDSSALLEKAVDDVIASAFRSAGQRCSALRMLYVQQDVADEFIAMLIGAAEKLTVGDPAYVSVDIGPLIDDRAAAEVRAYIDLQGQTGRLVWRGEGPKDGAYCAPAIVRLSSIDELESEVFGPVLHVATYPAGREGAVVDAINQKGFGLTFGVHSRIDRHIQKACDAINVGNVYINRNQIGAVVGSQPFGGKALSGTGPKAGGPLYLHAFLSKGGERMADPSRLAMPGPDGEQNDYSVGPRGRILVLHSNQTVQRRLAERALWAGNQVVAANHIDGCLGDIDAVVTTSDAFPDMGALRKSLAEQSDRLIPLIIQPGNDVWLYHERHICRDLTACGGNLSLLCPETDQNH